MAGPAFDELVKHRIGIERLNQTTIRQVIQHLEVVQADIAEQIAKDLTRIEERGPLLGAKSTERLKSLRRVIADALLEAHKALRSDLTDDLIATGRYEAEWLARFYKDGLGFAINFERPSAALLRSVVTAQPFQGAVLKDWAGKMEANQLDRISQHIRIGITEGESIPEIVRRLRGSRALKFRDGQFAKDKRGAEAVVRTAVNHTVNRAHEAFIEPHKEDFPRFIWVSVLDSRTTKLCRARSGQTYETGTGPLPPAHWNCRSTVRYISRFEKDPENEPTYENWLRGQDAETQDDILGKRAGILYRKGGLSVTQFVDRKGTALTLDELKRKEDAAWAKAFGK